MSQSYWLFTCAGQGETIPNGRSTSGLSADQRLVPHCPDGGQWQAITIHPEVVLEPGDSAALDLVALGEAFGAGFLFMGTGLLMAMAVRFVVKMVRDA